jgi:antitoxin HicB
MLAVAKIVVPKYPVLIRPLNEEEGGGYLAEVPDLPGCVSDGENPEKALASADGAIKEWIAAARAMGRAIPEPGAANRFSGKWVQRVPRSLHKKLSEEARREGVSLNSLALTLLAEGIGKRSKKKAA